MIRQYKAKGIENKSCTDWDWTQLLCILTLSLALKGKYAFGLTCYLFTKVVLPVKSSMQCPAWLANLSFSYDRSHLALVMMSIDRVSLQSYRSAYLDYLSFLMVLTFHVVVKISKVSHIVPLQSCLFSIGLHGALDSVIFFLEKDSHLFHCQEFL